MNTIIKRTWNQNRMVNIEALTGAAFQAEDGGHTFEISGINDANEAVYLSGTVAGVFMRPDGTDVALTGTASDGVVSVTLSDACYAVDGRFGLYIFVTSNSKKTCVYACIGTVAQTSYGTVAGDTPQDVVDLINAINAAIASIPADYSDLLDSIAPSFSDSTAYTTGMIVWYNGLLYQFTADKAAGSWDATKVRQISVATGQVYTSNLEDGAVTLAKLAADVKSYFALASDMNNVKNALGSDNHNLYPLYDQTSVVLYGGSTAHYDNWYSTDFIPCNAGDTYNIGAWGYFYNGINICPISFFNSNKEYIGAVSGEDIVGAAGNRRYECTAQFPNGTAYFKQAFYSGGGSENYTIISSLNSVKDLKDKVDTIYDSNMGYVPIEFATDVASVVLYGGGTGTFGNWYNTDFIPCGDAEKIKVVAWCYFWNGTDICPLSFFDENKTYVYGISGEHGEKVVGENRLYQGEVVIPENAKYFKLTTFKGSEVSGYSQASAELYQYVVEKDYIKNLNIVCIGDSLTEGDLGAEPYASRQNITPYNYPYWMRKYLGCSVENKGKSGYTTLQSWNNVVQNIDFTDKNTVIIMLGSNGGLTDTIDTDCSGDDYTQYANTNTGCYCKIIEYIMEQTNCAAQIILCTPPHVSTIRGSKRTSTIQAAEVVRKIAERYCLPLIDMMKHGGFSDYNENVFQPVDGLHFSIDGYKKMGTFIGSRVKTNNSIQISN